MQLKRPLVIILTIALLLLIPFIAMQFTTEVNWTTGDFAAAALLLFGAGLLFELVMRKVKKTSTRAAICLALFAALFLIWLELAVGVFGTPFAGH